MAGGHGVRKTVTVLFSDVTGSTALGEQLDPEATRRLLGRYFDEVRRIIERHEGTVEKFIGDAVMAVFGVPVAHEDDALRAVRAADEIRATLERLNESGGSRLETRTGVNTGEVVTGGGETLVTGDAVNVAARLEQAAAPGEILIGSSTHELVRDAVQAEPVQPLELKGKAQPVPAWRLTRVIEGAPTLARRLDASLVGRRSELEQLVREFARARDERACRLVTIIGDAGIGKSRLSRELGTAVAGEATLLAGRCLPYGEGITYWPLVEIVRAAARGRPIEELLEGRDDAGWIAERVGAVAGGADVATASDEIALAVRRLLERLARRRALIIEIDDVQWAEPRFLELIETVVLLARDAPILLVCLARPELLEDRPDWPGTILRLEPLSADESNELLAALDPLPDDARRRIAETAAGNPLFLEQMTALAAQTGNDAVLAVPPSIEALLAARLDRLETDERSAIERASIIGQEFWAGALRSLSPAGAQVGSALLRLVRRQLIEPHDSAFPDEDGYRFAHLLVRDAAYRAMPKELRAELHERFSDWIEAKDRERRSQYDEILGYHLEQAYRYREELGLLDESSPKLAERAAEHLAIAGDRAFARGDMPAAAKLIGRAAALLPESDRRQAELARTLAPALWESGDLTGGDAVLAEATEIASRLGDAPLQAHMRIGALSHRLKRPEAGISDMRRELNQLLTVFEEAGDSIGLARTWFLLSDTDWMESRAAAAEAARWRALEHARLGGDQWLQTLLLAQIAVAIVHSPTPVEEGVRRCEQLLDETSGARVVESAVLRALASLHAMQGHFDLARDELARGFGMLDELGLKHLAEASRGQATAFVEWLAGDLEAVEKALRGNYGTLAAMGDKAYRSTVAALLATVLVDLNRLDEAADMAEKSREIAAPEDLASQVGWRWAYARVLVRRGELDDAERMIREAVNLSEQTDFPNMRADTLGYLAEVLALAGRVDDAATVLERAIEIYEAKGNLVGAARAADRLEELRASVS
jgi:class 3 adenylate cyclase/tetratricopeptide (TPR) repeat protein